MKRNNRNMHFYQMLVCVGVVFIQVNGVNAQFGDIGNMLNKKLNKLKTPTNQPPAAVSDTTTVQTPTAVSDATTDKSEGGSANDPGKAENNPKSTADSSVKTATSLPLIYDAARQCDEVRFAELLKKDISSINKTVSKFLNQPIGQRGQFDDGYTLIAFAAEKGCTNIIQQLLDLDANVGADDDHSDNEYMHRQLPLPLAARNGHLEAVKMLLKAKADPNKGLAEACKNRHLEVLKTLIEAGARKSEACLENAAGNGYTEIVQLLLKDSSGEDGLSALSKAAIKGHLDIVKLFVANGADLTGDGGKRVIKSAIEENQAEVVVYLKDVKKSQEAVKEAAMAKEKATQEEMLAKKEAEEKAAKEKFAASQAEERATKEKEEATKNEVFKKQMLDSLDHPQDVYGLAGSRYRKFNGKVYDCAEPLEFLNKLSAFSLVDANVSTLPHSDREAFRGRLEEAAKRLNENPWNKFEADCTILPVRVRHVTPDGLIVLLKDESLALLKNHPKQKTYVDGDTMLESVFVMKSEPYQYTSVRGEIQTIHSYDFGVIVKPPSGSVPKIPMPDTSR